MPPAAALECERIGWTFDMIATVAPASAAARAARWPARPAPMIRTSCSGMGAAILLDRYPASGGRQFADDVGDRVDVGLGGEPVDDGRAEADAAVVDRGAHHHPAVREHGVAEA